MDLSMGQWKKSSNMVLVFIVFCAVGVACFAYLYVKKPALNININVAIIGSSVCGIVALLLFFLLLKRGSKKQVPLSYPIGE